MSLKNVARTRSTIHPRPCSCPGQCGGNCGSLAQSQRHKSNTRNWEIKFRLEMGYASMKWFEWTNHQDLLSFSSCRMQSAKLIVGRSVTAPLPGSCFDDRNNIKLMIPVRNNIVQVDKIELNYCNYKNTFKQWVQNVCRQGSEGGWCWPLLNASKQTQHVVKSLLSKSIALLLLLLLAIFNH